MRTSSISSTRAQRYGWLTLAVAGTAFLGLPEQAQAGVEFVTPTTSCQNRVTANGANVRIAKGNNMQIEVWGNSVDFANGSGNFRFSVASGPSTGVTARVVTTRSGATNLGRGCGNTGSAVIRIDSPTTGAEVRLVLEFKMPMQDWSRQTVTLRPWPTLTGATWQTLPDQCLTKTAGPAQTFNNGNLMRIQLPPGHLQDQTNCTTSMRANVTATVPAVDIPPPLFNLNVTGLPNFLTVTQQPGQWVLTTKQLVFNIDIARIRALTNVSNSTITITSPGGSSTTLRLEVRPDLGAGFSSAATANPAILTAGDPVDFTIRLSAPAGANQIITWRMTTPGCFVEANPQSPYNAAAPFQHFVFPQGQNVANIRVRSRTGTGCTNTQALVTHIFEAWVGDSRVNPQVTAPTSGSTYTRTTIQLRDPNGDN